MNQRIQLITALCLLAWPFAVPLRADDQAQQEAILRQRDAVLQKMAAIRIPQMDFRQANINDVVSFLQEASSEFDPKKRGVNMIFNPRPARTARAAPAEGSGEEPVPMITFKAEDMSLLEVLNVITRTANLEYRIEGSVVMIRPAPKPVPAPESAGGTLGAGSDEIPAPAPRTLTTPRLKRPGPRTR